METILHIFIIIGALLVWCILIGVIYGILHALYPTMYNYASTHRTLKIIIGIIAAGITALLLALV